MRGGRTSGVMQEDGKLSINRFQGEREEWGGRTNRIINLRTPNASHILYESGEFLGSSEEGQCLVNEVGT